MLVSWLAFTPPEDFYLSLWCKMDNLWYKVYTNSIQALYIYKISWLFQSFVHTNLPCLTELLEGLLCCLNPAGPPLPWASSSRLFGMVLNFSSPPAPCPVHLLTLLPYLPNTSINLLRPSMWKLPEKRHCHQLCAKLSAAQPLNTPPTW